MFSAYGLRLRRKAWLWRARRAAAQLAPVVDRTAQIGRDDILVFATQRNEGLRLPGFLDHYRALGAAHFLIVDNASQDGSGAYLADQPDVSVWRTEAGYARARFGTDWMMALLARHGIGHWVLIVDPDELLVYAHCDSRPLRALTDWLQATRLPAFPALLLDLYPGPPQGSDPADPSTDPSSASGAATGATLPPPEAGWYDPAGYVFQRDPRFGNLWVQGGPRARAFFAHHPARAPALNKVPLVRWRAGLALASSTHSLLPRGINRWWDDSGGLAASGCLLHTKFMAPQIDRAGEEAARRQHYAGAREYAAYRDGLAAGVRLWTRQSVRYDGWRGLERRGLLSAGDWA